MNIGSEKDVWFGYHMVIFLVKKNLLVKNIIYKFNGLILVHDLHLLYFPLQLRLQSLLKCVWNIIIVSIETSIIELKGIKSS